MLDNVHSAQTPDFPTQLKTAISVLIGESLINVQDVWASLWRVVSSGGPCHEFKIKVESNMVTSEF